MTPLDMCHLKVQSFLIRPTKLWYSGFCYDLIPSMLAFCPSGQSYPHTPSLNQTWYYISSYLPTPIGSFLSLKLHIVVYHYILYGQWFYCYSYTQFFYYSTLQQFFNESKSFQAPRERDFITIKCHELVANFDMEHIPHIRMRVQLIIWKVKHFQIFKWVLCLFHLSLISCPRKADPNPNIHWVFELCTQPSAFTDLRNLSVALEPGGWHQVYAHCQIYWGM